MMESARLLANKLIGFGGMTLLGGVMSILRICSFGRLIDLNRKVVAPVGCRLILGFAGVKVRKHIKSSNEVGIYMFNHNSFLDIFIIPMLGFKNTRYIISESTKSITPLRLCNYGLDVLYIPTVEEPERRVEFFKRVTSDLSKNKYSVICSPEGRHEFRFGISSFNNGVFHMAQESGRPIKNIFFSIPRDSDPLEGFDLKKCDVDIYHIGDIATVSWNYAKLREHKSAVRGVFLKYYSKIHGVGGDLINENS